MNRLTTPSRKTGPVAPLEHVLRTDLESAGGKGANLGELIRAGLPVPPGFVVTTAAYDRFLTLNGLGETIAQSLAGPQPNGASIREAFERAAIPADVERCLLTAYRQLGHGPVAVRSSATAEDLPEAAFAGQQDTYLNITGAEALLDAVRRCWASLWTDRAIAYRERQKIDQRALKLAVVVQRMVMADAAGVMFTANPVTGARDEVVIDASPGLGEAVVSGLVTPDHFVLRKRRWGWSSVERLAGRREVIIKARAGGGTEHVEGAAPAALDTPALPERAQRNLARLGMRIQRHFGAPQDVEWAWAHGKLYILQARPITALPDPPPHPNKVQRLIAGAFGEMFVVRPYPLDMTSWIPTLGSALEPIFALLGLEWSLSQSLEGEDGVAVRFSGRLPRPTWRILLAPARLIPRIRRYDPLHWQTDPLLAEAQARARDLESRDLRELSWEDLLETVHAAREVTFLAGELRCRYFPRAVFSMARLRLLLGLLGRSGRLGVLLSGVENKTLEVNRALEELADRVRSVPELASAFAAYSPESLWPALEGQPAGRAFLVELRAFIDHYGHREAIISTVLQPTWKDAPEVVLGIIKSFAAHPPKPKPGKADWQAARDELLQRPLLRYAPFRPAFLEILAQARTFLQIREDTHFYATLPMPLFRRAFLEAGRHLVSAGILDTPADVFHLKLDELERIGGDQPPPDLAAELRAVMLRRKEARARLEGAPLVDPRLFHQSAEQGDALLRGMPGSPGVAEGPARIVLDSSEFDRLVPGDVLVAPYTNPSWTPLFQRAVAVVVDSGSLGSHAAIVAREYGIPAVMSTVTGTQTLHDGERIRVDGSRGAVYRVTPTSMERNV